MSIGKKSHATINCQKTGKLAGEIPHRLLLCAQLETIFSNAHRNNEHVCKIGNQINLCSGLQNLDEFFSNQTGKTFLLENQN